MSLIPFILFHDEVHFSDELDQDIKYTFTKSVKNFWSYAKRDKGSAWGAIARMIIDDFDDDHIIHEDLWNMPMDMINWKAVNSDRTDLMLDQRPDRMNTFGKNSLYVLGKEESGYTKWNSDPYRLDNDGSGYVLYPGSLFHLPYWLMQFKDLV